jgi:short chain dehydrogenase
VVANAGINSRFVPGWELSEEEFINVVQLNLGGTWRTVKAAAPHLLAAGEGGAIVVIGSDASIKGLGNLAPYSTVTTPSPRSRPSLSPRPVDASLGITRPAVALEPLIGGS